MPCAASGNDRTAVYALIASFDRPYAFDELLRVRFAPRARARRNRASPAARTSSSDVLHPADARGRRDARDRATPSIMFGITASVSCRSPQKLTSITSRFGERVRQSRAVEQRVDDRADLVDRRRRSASGRAEVASRVAGEPGDVGLLDVDRVHFGAEIDEDLRRRRAHSRSRAGDDHALALVAEHVHSAVRPRR